MSLNLLHYWSIVWYLITIFNTAWASGQTCPLTLVFHFSNLSYADVYWICVRSLGMKRSYSGCSNVGGFRAAGSCTNGAEMQLAFVLCRHRRRHLHSDQLLGRRIHIHRLQQKPGCQNSPSHKRPGDLLLQPVNALLNCPVCANDLPITLSSIIFATIIIFDWWKKGEIKTRVFPSPEPTFLASFRISGWKLIAT